MNNLHPIQDILKNQQHFDSVQELDFNDLQRYIQFKLSLVQKQSSNRLMKFLNAHNHQKTVVVPQSEAPGPKKKGNKKLESLQKLLQQKREECEKKAQELQDLFLKFSGHDQKLQQLNSELESYRFQLVEITQTKSSFSLDKNEQAVQAAFPDPIVQTIQNELLAVLSEN